METPNAVSFPDYHLFSLNVDPNPIRYDNQMRIRNQNTDENDGPGNAKLHLSTYALQNIDKNVNAIQE